MASQISTRAIRIKFDEAGLDKILERHKELRDRAKETLTAELKALEVLKQSGSDSEIREKKKLVQNLKKDYEALDTSLKSMDVEFNTVKDAIMNIDQIGPRMINKLLASLNRFGKQAGALTDDNVEKLRFLEGAVKEVAKAISEGFQKGVVDLTSPLQSDATYTELRNLTKQYEQYGKAIAEAADDYDSALKTMGERATEAKIRIGEMEHVLTALNDNADNDRIKEYIRGWQEIADYAGATEQQVRTAQMNIEEGRKRIAQNYLADLQNPLNISQSEISEAVKYLKEYGETTKLTEESQKSLNLAIAKGEDEMKAFATTAKTQVMEEKLKNIGALSKKALEEQRKFWQETMDNAVNPKQYNEAQEHLENIKNELSVIAKNEVFRKGLLSADATNGKTISQVKEYIKLLKDYRETLDVDDIPGLREADEAIARMNDTIAKTNTALVSARKFLFSDAVIKPGTTIESLDEIKKGLHELRKQTDITTSDGKKRIGEIDKALAKVDKRIGLASMSQERFDEIIRDPKKVHSLDELTAVYEELQREIKQAGINQEEFTSKAQDIQSVKEQMDKLNDSVKGGDEFFGKIKNKVIELVTYKISLEGFVNVVKDSFTETLSLSDAMTNVQKVTKMTNNEIAELTNKLQAMDTREATAGLMEFAEQGGKLGLYDKYGIEGIFGFARISEKIDKTLGDDIGGSKAVSDLAKLNDILKVTEQMGNNVEKALEATGSAVLNLGNNTAASYPAIVQYVGRTGALGASLKMTLPQIAALGGTLDALKVPAEQGSTALGQIFAALKNRTEELSKAARVNTREMNRLLATGKGFDALLILLDAIKREAVTEDQLMANMSGRAKSSVAIRRVWQTLAQNIDTLTENLGYAQEGFDSVAKTVGLLDMKNRDYIEGLSQQSVMAAEFAKVNANAAGMSERLANRWREFISNSKSVKAFTLILKLLTDFVEWLNNGSAGATTLKKTLQTLITTLALFQLKILHTMKAIGLAFVNGTKVIFQYTLAVFNLGKTVDKTTASFKRMRAAALKNLFTVIATALIWIAVEAMNAADSIDELTEAIGESEAEQLRMITTSDKMFESLDKESKALSAAKEGTDEYNEALEKKREMIDLINSRYNKYLGFMLTETTQAETIAAAHELVTAKIKEEMQVKRQNMLLESVDQKYADDMTEYYTELIDKIHGIKQLTSEQRENFAKDITSYVNDAVKRKATKSEIARGVMSVGSNYKVRDVEVTASGDIIEDDQYNPVKYLGPQMGILNKYISTLIDYSEEYERLFDSMGSIMKSVTPDDVKTATQNMVQALWKEVEILQEGGVEKGELKEMVDKLEAINSQGKQIGGKEGYEIRKRAGELLAEYRPILKDLIANEIGESIWGKSGEDYSTWKDEKLAAEIKRFNEISNALQEGIDLYEAYPSLKLPEGIDEESVKDWLYEEATKMKDILEARNKSTQANFKWGSENEQSKKAKEEYEAAIANLDAYYQMRKTIVDNARNKEEITEAEANRRTEYLDIEHMHMRAELRKNALSKLNAMDRRSFEEWWSSIEYLDEVNWAKIRQQTTEWGKKYSQRQLLEMEKDLSKVETVLQKHRDNIEKIILGADPVKALADEFGSSMDALNMIFGLYETDEERTKALGNKRLQQLMSWAKDAYSLTVEELKAQMSEESNIYNAWYRQLGDDKETTIQAMLVRLRKYSDDMNEVVRSSAKENMRLINQKWSAGKDESGFTRGQRNELLTLEGKAGTEASSVASTAGYGQPGLTGRMELDLIKMQIEAKKEYINYIREEQEAKMELARQQEEALLASMQTVGFDSLDSERNYLGSIIGNSEYSDREQEEAKERLAEISGLEQELAERRQSIANLEMETNIMLADSYTQLGELRDEELQKTIGQYEQMFEVFKNYSTNITTFSESFGEGIFGSKEDRQSAFKQLQVDLLRSTKTMVEQYLIDVATAKITNESKLALYRQYAAQKMLIDLQLLQSMGQTEINGLAIEQAITNAKVAADQTKAISREVATKGLVGLAIGTAISAALGLLLGAATSKINKSKSEIASASGASAGKMVTGMMTYASGKYPYSDGVTYSVTGNNGRTYDARYTDSLKTGIYHGPHMAVFSEEGDEMVIDSKTLKRMPKSMIRDILMIRKSGNVSMNYGLIADAMRTLNSTRTSSLANTGGVRGIRTYADGNIERVANDLLSQQSVQQQLLLQLNNDKVNETLQRNNEIMAELTAVLAGGIGVNMKGDKGLYSSEQRYKRWMERNRM